MIITILAGFARFYFLGVAGPRSFFLLTFSWARSLALQHFLKGSIPQLICDVQTTLFDTAKHLAFAMEGRDCFPAGMVSRLFPVNRTHFQGTLQPSAALQPLGYVVLPGPVWTPKIAMFLWQNGEKLMKNNCRVVIIMCTYKYIILYNYTIVICVPHKCGFMV